MTALAACPITAARLAFTALLLTALVFEGGQARPVGASTRGRGRARPRAPARHGPRAGARPPAPARGAGLQRRAPPLGPARPDGARRRRALGPRPVRRRRRVGVPRRAGPQR